MDFKNGFFGSTLMATLLFTGCNTVSDNSSNGATAPQGDTEIDTSVNAGQEDGLILTGDVTSETQAASLKATSRNVKIAMAKLGSSKSLQSADADVALADIIYTFFSDDISSGEGNQFALGGARAYFQSLVDGGSVNLTIDEKVEFSIMSEKAFNEAFSAGFFAALSNKPAKNTNGFLDSLRDKIKESAEKLVDNTKDAIENVKEDVAEVKEDVKETVEAVDVIAKDKVEDKVEDVVTEIKDVVAEVKEKVEESVNTEKLEEKIEELKELSEKVEEAVDVEAVEEKIAEVVEEIKVVVEEAKEVVEEIAPLEKITEKVEVAVEEIKQQVEEVKEQIVVEEKIEEVKEKIEEIVAEVKEQVDVEEVKEKLEELKEVVAEAKETVEEVVAVEKIEEKVQEVKEKVEEKVEEIVQKVEEEVNLEEIEAKIEEIKEIVVDEGLKEAAEKIEEVVAEVKEKVEEIADVEQIQEKVEELKEVIEEAKEQIKEIEPVQKIEAKIEEIVAEVKETVEEIDVAQVEEKIEEKIEEIKVVIEEAKEKVAIDETIEEVKEKVEEVIVDVKEKVEEVADIEKIEEKVEELKEVIEEAKEKVEEIADIEKIEEKIEEAVEEIKEIVDVEKIEEKIEEIKEEVAELIDEPNIHPELPEEDKDTASIDTIVEEIFTVALNDGSISTDLLIAALGDSAAADAFINSLKENWTLTLKMNPLLKSDKSFGERLTELMIARADCAKLIFDQIDQPLYSALTSAMVLSPETTGNNMSKLLNTYAIEQLVVPSDNDALSSLLFDTGTTARGDGNELANERLLYSIFSNTDSVSEFVAALVKVKENDAETSAVLLDQLLLGGAYNSEANEADVDQSFYNIYAIARGMTSGIADDGISEYKAGLGGFTRLMPVDRFWPYSKTFVNAGVNYFVGHDLDYGDFLEVAEDAAFNYDAEDNAKVVQSKRLMAEGDEADVAAEETTWYDDLWSAVTGLFDGTFESFSAWWDETSDEFSTYISDITEGVTTELHVYLEEQIRALIGEDDYVLPPFDDISIDYATGEVERRINDYLSVNGYADILRDFSENEYVEEFLYVDILGAAQGTEYWEYIPSWLTGMDWLKLPASFADYQLEFTADNVAVYLISKNDSLENMRDVTGLGDRLIQVDTIGDSPITNETDEFYIYKVIVFSADDIDFEAIAANVDDASEYISGVVVDTDDAVATGETTTTEETTTN
jgi:methyl-accepting chemotaxis protein